MLNFIDIPIYFVLYCLAGKSNKEENLMIKVFKSFLMFTLIVGVMSAAAFAEVKFKDVPADHWAAKSVYDLVKLGVTQGYPDGTFRGKKNITRFETAIFLSKLSEKLGGSDMVQLKKDITDIKNE